MDLPWFKFFPRDWLGDVALSTLGFEAQGLWFRMICFMDSGTPRGHLIVGGKPLLTGIEMARAFGGTPERIDYLLKELERANVFSRTQEGVIFCRRMVRDTKQFQMKRSAGKRGGNPNCKDTRQPQSVIPLTDQEGQAPPEIPPNNSSDLQPPTPQMVISAMVRIADSLEAERCWNYWESKGWKDSAGKSILPNWENRVKTWTRRGNSSKASSSTSATPPRERWKIQKEIDLSNKRTEELKLQLSAGNCPEAKQKLVSEKKRRTKLKVEFDNAPL